ncbi:MAG: sialidase, partial [Pseudomonadota bacterium]|nr:sialidase [Pseudomonadota bacterium]
AAGVFYIAAEAGYLFRSDDGGHTWKELPSPYGGSFFGILPLDGEALLAYGLRGNIFRSADKGQSWVQITTGTTALLTDAARLPDGTIVITGMAGVVLFSSDTGKSFTLLQPNRISLTSVVNTVSNTLVVAGERGPQIYNLPESTK